MFAPCNIYFDKKDSNIFFKKRINIKKGMIMVSTLASNISWESYPEKYKSTFNKFKNNKIFPH